jgi:predicted branched-subunit amino acid permease
MVSNPQVAAIALTATLGALAEAAVALRWYEPPERDGERPTPVFEAGLFFVVFWIGFSLLGVGVGTVAGFAPPLGTAVTFVLVPVGVALAYASYTDRLGPRPPVQRYVASVVGGVLAVYPVAFAIAGIAGG